MSEDPVRRRRGPDLRPRRSRRGTSLQGRPNRSSDEELPIQIGRLYLLNDRLVQITRRTIEGRLVVTDQDTGSERTVLPGELRARPTDLVCGADHSAEERALSDRMLTEAQRAESVRRLDLIRPLLDPAARTKQVAIRVSCQAGTSTRTVYRWLGAYLEGGLSALAPAARGVATGTVRVDSRVEQIIESVIHEAFQAGEGSITALGLLPKIHAACDRLTPSGGTDQPVSYPGKATLQRRLSRLRKHFQNHVGETRRILRERQQPVTGSIDARRVLEIVEVDHTVIDVHAVDAETLEPIGRPTFTVAIDVFTRCVLGFVLMLMPPCALAAALCLQRMRFPKEPWLKQIGLDIEWPMYGAPEIIQTDSAKEFPSPGFRYGCERMGSQPRTRPLAAPRYGGTCERLIGTFMRKFRLLPGASYNDMLGKATRKPVREACYTLSALEWELVREIALYHDTRHRVLGMTPRQAWDQAFAVKGRIAPALPTISPELCVIDFLPRIERKVGREGIEYGGRFYWAEELRPLIPQRPLITLRPDPRNVRHLWLQLPELGYVRSTLYKPRDFQGVTLWDWRGWRAQRRGPPVLNHTVHADLLDDSRERRKQAAAKVRAHRNTAKTVTQTRRREVQNRLFQQETRADRERSDPSQAPKPVEPGAPDGSRRPELRVVRSTAEGPDLSRLPATPRFVFRRTPRQR